MNKKIEIPAIHDNDLRTILDEYGLSKKIDTGLLKCTICENILTWDNIAGLKVINDTIDIFCDDPNCIEIATNK